MYSNRALRALLISTLFFLGSFLSAFNFIQPVSAESISGETTFYFTNALSTDIVEDVEFDFIPVSLDKPLSQNDSKYPPSIFRKNESKTFIKQELNTEEMLYWLGLWSFYILDTYLENLSDEFGDFFEGIEILLPHPYRIVEGFENSGNDTIDIHGDVVFDLYFSSNQRQRFRQRYRDEVKVGLYSMDFLFINEIKNSTQQIKPGSIIQNGISRQKITIENVNLTLKPGESLLFSIEIIQSNKSRFIGSLLKNSIDEERFLNNLEKLATRWENTTGTREKIGTFLKEFIPIIKGLNFTIDDIAKFFDTFRSSSLVYDSAAHPSSVTMEFLLPGADQNTKLYYLHKDNKMDTTEPSEGSSQNVNLQNTITKWDGPILNDRNKIVKDVSVDLFIKYINFLNPGRIKVAVSLFDGDNEISDPKIKELDRANIQAHTPTTFTFEDVDYELEYEHGLSIGVALSNGSNTRLRKVKLLFDSTENPSSVKVTFTETDNIQCDYSIDPIDALIVPGGSVKYTLNITAKKNDEVTVTFLEEKVGDWDVTISQDQLKISEGETVKTHIFANSTNKNKDAYGDMIDLTIITSGKTGIDRKIVSAGVSETGIEYDVNILNYTESKYISRGKNGTFSFIIENNNTGADDDVDSYVITVTSKNNWNIKHTDSISNLGREKKTGSGEIIVIVTVPKNTSLKSDTITFTVTSVNGLASASVDVTVDVIGPGILESIYEFFESASTTLGLDEMFGTYAPIALVSILMIVILFIIIIFALLLTRKFITIICTERIKEIDPDDKASFEITLENPTRKIQTYEISTDTNPSSTKWEKSLEEEKVTIGGHQTKTIFLSVKPTDLIEPNDWIETKVKVNISGKRKSEEITTMTMVREGKTHLKITDVITWPKEFKKGDRIITSFKLENKGTISAKNVLVVLYINDKEKNKVEVTVPPGGYADIKIPWIALKGKNDLHIKAIEQ